MLGSVEIDIVGSGGGDEEVVARVVHGFVVVYVENRTRLVDEYACWSVRWGT